MAQQPLVCQGLLIIEGSWSHSVRLLWTSDQPDAQTSTWQRNNQNRQRFMAPDGIRTLNPSKRAAADSRLRPRDQCDRHSNALMYLYIITRGSKTVHPFFHSEWKITVHESTFLKKRINRFSNCLLLIATKQSKVTSKKHYITHYIVQGVQKSTLQLNTHHTLQCSIQQ